MSADPTADPPAPPGGRLGRRAAVAAVAVAAAGAGALFGWRRFQLGEPGELDAFWTLSFPTPDGGTLQLATLRGRPLLLNFWATWCPPCIEELPLLSSFHAQNRANGWQLLGLAVDRPEPVARFLARSPVGFPIGLAGLEGVELTRQLGNAAGGLPFSVLFDADGRVHDRKLGQLHAPDLARWRQALAPA